MAISHAGTKCPATAVMTERHLASEQDLERSAYAGWRAAVKTNRGRADAPLLYKRLPPETLLVRIGLHLIVDTLQFGQGRPAMPR